MTDFASLTVAFTAGSTGFGASCLVTLFTGMNYLTFNNTMLVYLGGNRLVKKSFLNLLPIFLINGNRHSCRRF